MFFCLFVKARIYRIEILRVHAVLSKTEGISDITLSNRWGALNGRLESELLLGPCLFRKYRNTFDVNDLAKGIGL